MLQEKIEAYSMEKNSDYFKILMKLHSIAKIGLLYSKDPYAIENYQEINDITKQAISSFSSVSIDRPNYFARDVYPTPNLSTRTFLFNEKGEVLMVKEAKTGEWSFPGGWVDLYDTPSESARKECMQEAGADIEIHRLVGILDHSAYTSSKMSEFVILFEGRVIGSLHSHTHETTNVQYFPLDSLPVLSTKLSESEMKRIIQAIQKRETIFD